MRAIIPVLIMLILLSCQGESNKKTTGTSGPEKPAIRDSFLITDNSWGGIDSTATRARLDSLFGAGQVRDERICGPECVDSIDVTQVYPGTPRAFTVYWVDGKYHQQIEFIRLYTEGSPWHTTDSLAIGVSLRHLLRLNGKPVSFSGFGWDYGGYVGDFNGGTLANRPLGLRLELPYTVNSTELLGDISLRSDMPAVQKMADSIYVAELSLRFHVPSY